MNIPYKQLTLFVIGILATVFITIIFTEKYLSSTGFEYRKKIYYCLVDNLNDKNITDEFFPSLEPIADEIEDANCSVVLQQFDMLGDMKHILYSSYNTTSNLCEDKNVTLCSSAHDEEGSHNQSTNKSSCINSQTKKHCDAANICHNCVNEKLTVNDDYENILLHAKAVNLTIINFKVWNYFLVSSRVHELQNEAYALESDALNACKVKDECADVLLR